MISYQQFINKAKDYQDLLMLRQEIMDYEYFIDRNKEESRVVKNFLERSQAKKELEIKILNQNNIISPKDLKEKILEQWSNFYERMLIKEEDINLCSTSCNKTKNLPLYAVVQNIVLKDHDFISIYQTIIDNGLYDPNYPCGTSNEPFFTMLPIHPLQSLSNINEKVTKDKRADFHLFCNGTDIIERAIWYARNGDTEEDRNYWHSYILWCVQGNCSLLDSKRFYSSQKKKTYEYTPSIFALFERIKDFPKIKEYVLAEEGVEKQISNSIYPSNRRNVAIDFYSTLIADESLKRKLTKLKI